MNKCILILSIILITLLPLAISVNPVQAASVTINTPSKDAAIYTITADQNYGADNRLDVGDAPGGFEAIRSLVQFDLPPSLSGATITSATLNLWGPIPWSGGAPSGQVVRVCRLTQDWVEGTGTASLPTQDGVTWNEYNYHDGLATATNDWATPGGDYTLTDSATVTLPSYPLPSPFQSWTVTNIVQGWANGDHPNYGFLIKFDDESLTTAKGGIFPSKEYPGVPSPQLEITYTAAIPVYVDIKPGSWPNPLQLHEKGVLPVTICGTEDLDITTIDPETVRLTLEGLGVGVPPLRWTYEDVATPYMGEPWSGHDLGPDGYLDLTLKFKTQEVIQTLGLDAFGDGDVVILLLTGNIKAEFDGTAVHGQDYVWILHK